MYSLILGAFVIVAIGSSLIASWFFLRPGGVVESSIKKSDQRLSGLEDSSWESFSRIAKMEANQASLEQRQEDLRASVNSRIASFESRYGKVAKKEEQLEMQKNLYDAIANQSTIGG